MNIVQNACDAIEGQAHQTLNVDIFEADGWAVVRVTDNGPGITDEALPNLFEPFFTTKPVGKGTGLGLSISYKIIEEHGGQLRACNLEHIPKSVQRFSEKNVRQNSDPEHIPKSVQRFSEKNVRQNNDHEHIHDATQSEFAHVGASFEFSLPLEPRQP
jgi:signal transduction histidine kinase